MSRSIFVSKNDEKKKGSIFSSYADDAGPPGFGRVITPVQQRRVSGNPF